MKRICVYCGSSPGKLPEYRRAAQEIGYELATRGLGLVYGGASVGLMGVVADAVLEKGGEVHGVIPRALATKEIAHGGLTELHVVDSMHARKAKMAALSGGFVALPGGWGTFEEIFEVLTWAQLGMHEKPCGLLSVAGYYDRLYEFLEHAIEHRFVREEYRHMLIMDNEPAALLDRFASYRAPRVKKWLSPDQT